MRCCQSVFWNVRGDFHGPFWTTSPRTRNQSHISFSLPTLRIMSESASSASAAAVTVTREYQEMFPLKYGCNPHQVRRLQDTAHEMHHMRISPLTLSLSFPHIISLQNPATIMSLKGAALPFTVLNGKPGYINLLDAINAWQVRVR